MSDHPPAIRGNLLEVIEMLRSSDDDESDDGIFEVGDGVGVGVGVGVGENNGNEGDGAEVGHGNDADPFAPPEVAADAQDDGAFEADEDGEDGEDDNEEEGDDDNFADAEEDVGHESDVDVDHGSSVESEEEAEVDENVGDIEDEMIEPEPEQQADQLANPEPEGVVANNAESNIVVGYDRVALNVGDWVLIRHTYNGQYSGATGYIAEVIPGDASASVRHLHTAGQLESGDPIVTILAIHLEQHDHLPRTRSNRSGTTK